MKINDSGRRGRRGHRLVRAESLPQMDFLVVNGSVGVGGQEEVGISNGENVPTIDLESVPLTAKNAPTFKGMYIHRNETSENNS